MAKRRFGEIILKERERQGLTRPDLSRRCGVTVKAIEKCEKGCTPSVERASAMLEGLGLYMRIGAPRSGKRAD